MATIQKRQGKSGTSYRVMIRLKGHPPDAATFRRLADAKRWAAETEAAIRAGRYFGVARRRTFAELADEYVNEVEGRLKSAEGIRANLAWWVKEFDGLTLDDIKPRRISAARDTLATEKDKAGKVRTGATVNRYLATLSSCFTFAVRVLEWVSDNPVSRVAKLEESEGRTRFLSDDELTALLKECRESTNEHLYLAVVLALTTGARQNEILRLRWPQIDFDRRTIRLGAADTKTRRARILPLSGEACELLQARDKVRKRAKLEKVADLAEARAPQDDRVFLLPAETRPFGSLRTSWLKALERAEIHNFRWHDLRHTAASYLAMQGFSLLEIGKVLGHRTLEMTMRYSHLSETRTVELGDALSDRLGLKGKSNTAA